MKCVRVGKGSAWVWLPFFFVFANGVSAVERRVTSPDGKVAVVISDEGGAKYRVEVDGQPLLKPSRLGLEFANGLKLGPAAKMEKVDVSDYDGYWDNRFGSRRSVREHWNQLAVTFLEKGVTERRLGVVVRVFDDGVALRYDLTEASKLNRFVLYYEQTEFAFADDYRCWAGEPSSCAENQYPETKLSAIPRRDANGVYRGTLPLVVQTPKALVAVAESDLRNWAGMSVCGTGSPTLRVLLTPRGDGCGCVTSQVPRTSPWRVLMIARTAAGLIESDLIANLATPCQIPDTAWIVPGASSWDPWWTGVNPRLPSLEGVGARGDTQAHKEYIDFAAEMGWPYKIVDWFWYENMSSYDTTLNLDGKNPERPPVDFGKCAPTVDLPVLLDYAKQRQVRLIVWVHSYDLERYGIEQACALFSKWGVAGLKIDFMNSDSQETVAWYEKVLSTAARHNLLIDFHGSYKATGLARTWPNFITQEGVLGNEYNKLDGGKCTPLHTVTLPFTRGLLGPMDFTPGGFINVTPAQFKIAQPAAVMGTRARQLAMPVVYLSPLTVFCDSPTNYHGAAGIEFYRNFPTVWDDTVVPSADVARHLVIARRSGDRWWLAAMNGNDALKLHVPLRFLGAGNWNLHSYADAPDAATEPTHVVENARAVTSADAIDIDLAPAGGFAATLSKP